MKVSELGEFGLIELLKELSAPTWNKNSPSGKNLIIGIGDDAAAWHGESSIQLVTVDSFIQGVHFSLDITPWEALGWKALAVNLSDIAAMGGMPRYAVVSLAVPEHTEVEEVTALYRGMMELALKSDTAVIGGDTSRAPEVALNITVTGSTSANDEVMLTRSGAKGGDQIAVTGSLGGSGGGFKMLTQNLKFNTESAARLKEAFLYPQPRIAEGQLLLRQGIRAAIDISDGLISDLGHICRASGLGARIYADRVPVHPDAREGFGDEEGLKLALSGGEDYELLFTGSAGVIGGVKKLSECPVTVIGEMVTDKENRVAVIDNEGKHIKIDSGGWDHFTGSPK